MIIKMSQRKSNRIWGLDQDWSKSKKPGVPPAGDECKSEGKTAAAVAGDVDTFFPSPVSSNILWATVAPAAELGTDTQWVKTLCSPTCIESHPLGSAEGFNRNTTNPYTSFRAKQHFCRDARTLPRQENKKRV